MGNLDRYVRFGVRHCRFAAIPREPILDVGSGSNPLWRANVLLDRYISDGKERSGRIVVDRPIVCGDVHQLPFPDQSFVFAHCSHVLEHLPSPENAVAELVRVARAGYVEVPSEIFEYCVLNFPFHRWAVSLEDSRLVFREKPHVLPTHPLIEAIKNPANHTGQLLRSMRTGMNVLQVFWKGSLSIDVHRREAAAHEGSVADLGADHEHYVSGRSRRHIKRLLNRLYGPPLDLKTVVACPVCKHLVQWHAEHVQCVPCALRFPLRAGVPVMLLDEATPV